LQLFLIADSEESRETFETFRNDEYYHDPKFLKTHLQFFQTRLLKLEKQNWGLTNEVKEVQKQIES